MVPAYHMVKSRATVTIQAFRSAMHPTRLARYRLLRPLAHRLGDTALCSKTPRALAIGVGCGLLWAFWLPIGQIVPAVGFAILLRGNVWAAALSTFVSNPLTLAPIAYLAHALGLVLLDPQAVSAFNASAHGSLSSLALLDAVRAHVANLGLPWLLGTAALGPLAALAGLLITLAFSMVLRRRSPAERSLN